MPLKVKLNREIFGLLNGNSVSFYYEQENINGKKSYGQSQDKIELSHDGKIRLIGEWEWKSKEGKGTCVLE